MPAASCPRAPRSAAPARRRRERAGAAESARASPCWPCSPQKARSRAAAWRRCSGANSTTPARAATCAASWPDCAARGWRPPSAPIGDRLRLGADLASDIDAFRGAAAVGDGVAALARLARAPARRLRADRGGGIPRVARRAARPPHPALARAGGAASGALRGRRRRACRARLARPPGRRRPLAGAAPRQRHAPAPFARAAPARARRLGALPPGAARRARHRALAGDGRPRRADPLARAACRRWRCVAPTRRCAASRRRSSAAPPRWRGCASKQHRHWTVLLEGEAGVGKTRLAQEVLRAGSTVAVRCEAIAREAPLHAVTEALRALLEAPERLSRLGQPRRRRPARSGALAAGTGGTSASRRSRIASSRRRPRRAAGCGAGGGGVDRVDVDGGSAALPRRARRSPRPTRRARRLRLDRRCPMGRRVDPRPDRPSGQPPRARPGTVTSPCSSRRARWRTSGASRSAMRCAASSAAVCSGVCRWCLSVPTTRCSCCASCLAAVVASASQRGCRSRRMEIRTSFSRPCATCSTPASCTSTPKDAGKPPTTTPPLMDACPFRRRYVRR